MFICLLGVFPQDDYPEEVSTDEDDEMFGSRKRLKRKGRRQADEEEEEEEEVPAAKKKKKSGNYVLIFGTAMKIAGCLVSSAARSTEAGWPEGAVLVRA